MVIVIDCYHISKEMRGMGIYLNEILGATKLLPEINFHLLTNSNESADILKNQFYDLENINIKVLKSPLPIYEQILLPAYCHKIRTNYLISSGNTASIFGVSKKQILLIHDVYYLKKKKDSKGANSIKRKLGEIYRRLTIRMAAKKSLGIISVSEFAKNDIVKELGVISQKVVVIHNGVDVNYSMKYEDLSFKKKRILMVSGSSPQKNLPATISALISNKSLNDQFEGIDIVGVSSAEDIGLQDSSFVSYHGHVDRLRVKKFYQDSTHFILPSFYESFGIPAIEALMAGCDVYLSNRGAMCSLLEGAGSYYDPLNEKEVNEIVIKIAQLSPLTHDEYQKNIYVANRYTWENSLLSFKDYLDAL